MSLPLRLTAIGLTSVLALTACQNDTPTSAAPSANASAEQPGWLNDSDRKILRLQVDEAAAMKLPAARFKAIATTLAEIEEGRLPKSWTSAAKAAATGSAPKAHEAMWKAAAHADDLEPLTKALCRKGQLGLENIERVLEEIRSKGRKAKTTLENMVFQECKVGEVGFLDSAERTNGAAMVFGALAYNHLKSESKLSPEETEALRAFVRHFSDFYLTKRILPRSERGPAPSAKASSSADPAPAPSK